MRGRPWLALLFGLVLVVVAALGALQWHARYVYRTRGWALEFPQPIADTPGATGEVVSRACVNAPLLRYDDDELSWALGEIEAGGFAWVRVGIPWALVEPTPGEWRWEAIDRAIEAAVERGLRLLVVLEDPPAWAGLPPDGAAFARYAEAVARRYGDALTYYQIWHNPNLGDSWGGKADPFGYADLLTRAAAAIRGTDADARIVLGSLAPTVELGGRNYAEALFLEMLYDAGAADAFDVVAAQPYGFDTGPDDRRVHRDVLNFSRVILLREALVAAGEGHKAIWASNFGWNSLPASWPGAPSIWGQVDEATQAAHTAEALARVEREWPWMGVMCLNGFQPRPAVEARAVPDAQEHWGFALVGPEGERRPVFEAVQAWTQRAPVAHAGVYRADTDLARFVGPWTLGPQGADIGEHGENRVSLVFEGTDVALTVRRGPYRAFLYVTVDGEPAPALPRDRQGRAYVVLYDPLAATVTVPLAEGLDPGRHEVEIVADRGWGQWALADWRIVDAPVGASAYRWGYAVYGGLAILGLSAVVWSVPRVHWAALQDRVGWVRQRLAEWLQVLLSLLVGLVTLFAAWQTIIGDALFRRLGEHGDVVALALTTGLFYFSPWFLVTLGTGALLVVIVIVRPDLGLALTMVAAPFYALDTHPLSVLGKSFSLAEIVLIPTLAGWALRWAAGRLGRRTTRGPRLSATAKALLRPLALLAGIAVLSSAFAEHPREALRELRLVILEPVLFCVALAALPSGEAADEGGQAPSQEPWRARWRVLDAFVLSALLVAVIGLVRYASGDVITAEGGVRRLRSIYGSPNNVGLYLGRVVPLIVALVLWGDGAGGLRAWFCSLLGDRRRMGYLGAAVPIVAALALSLSRGALVLGLPAALVAMGLLAGRTWRRVTLVAVVVAVVAFIVLLQVPGITQLPRLGDIFDVRSGTGGFRVALWYSSLWMVRDHPLLGVGPDNFLYAYRTRYVLPTAWEEFNLSHPHNVAFEFATRLGLLGLGTFIWSQVSFWRHLARLRGLRDPRHRALAIGLAGSMVDFLAHGLVDAAFFVIDLAFVYALSLAIVVWLDQVRRDDHDRRGL
ncbi:MAG: O-antigen ligase family protein [Anaerolineae bacterium]